jgi:hypothetical protein
MLLAALSISHLSATVHAAFLSAILLAWLPGVRATVLGRVARPWEPYTKVAARLDAWGGPNDIVLVRSIPSGVVGVARYMKGDIPLAAWVTQLGARQVPADVERLLRGRRRVAVASIHALSAAGPLEQWLQAHARPLGNDTFKHSSATVLYFGPEDGSVFFPESSRSEGPAGSGR